MVASRQEIQSRLLAFTNGQTLPAVAGELFAALGYGSNRRLPYASAEAFFSQYDPAGKVASAYHGVDGPVLFQQLTSEEIAANSGDQLLLDGTDGHAPDLRQIDSYLFLALDLPPSASLTRGDLAERARAVNALFPQPVLTLFRQGSNISVAITYRRPHKRENSRDVIDRKVTIIRDISCRSPHPGHVSILEDFSLPALARARQRDIRSFNDLDDAWRESLSTQILNRQFYREIANWYFWAREHAVFPKDASLDAEGKPSLPLIRLLTRLIFCWFLREKMLPDGNTLIPAELFETARIRELLGDSSPEATTYYTGILQNLFFATLNAEMDEAGKPPNRHFIGEGKNDEREEHFNAAIWRNPQLLADRPRVEAFFRRIPFLNGGLFECLDEPMFDESGKKIGERRVDGFSTKPFKQAKLPNFLFFGPDRTEDLSGAYGDNSRRQETVRPLLEIFRRYKFTLTENTPIEEEVALDPELLGHVFENLLAAYNPETGTVARKATGSFYTPRIVVDWMVDEALIIYLTERVPAASEASVRDLLSWERDTHDLPTATVSALIDAVDSLKSLDPACGSGAFPMGLLQKLVHLLRKLDPHNKQWEARQRAAADQIESAPARAAALDALGKAFARDQDDYGRKLYLIENCLYGVDIQPIAVQIAKLRFFIALVVDQGVTTQPEENYGILPLPNLETKIVAANTLLGVKMGQLDFDFAGTRSLSDELQRIRHEYFTARKYAQKKDLKARDAKLRKQLAAALASSEVCSAADAKRLADWNPYDTNREAPFFDPAWMFGLAVGRKRPSAATFRGNLTAIVNQAAGQMELTGSPEAPFGFDLVLGNPPYVRQEELKNVSVQDSAGRARPLKEVLKESYECFTGTADLYVYFIERSFQLLRNGGVLSFITSNKYFRAAYGERLRTYLLYATRPRVLLDFGDAPLFTAIAYPCILVAQRTRAIEKGKLPPSEKFASEASFSQLITDEAASASIRVFPWTPGPPLRDFPSIFAEKSFALRQGKLKPRAWRLESPVRLDLLDRIKNVSETLDSHCKGRLYWGIKTGFNEAFVVDRTTRDRLIAEDSSSNAVLKPFLRGRDIKRWRSQSADIWLVYIPWHFPLHQNTSVTGVSQEAENQFQSRYPAIYKHLLTFRDDLESRNVAETGVRYEWYALQRWGSEYWHEFAEPKIFIPAISATVNFAPDFEGLYCNNKASICVPPNVAFASAILNSRLSAWCATQICASKEGGFWDFEPRYSRQFPIPHANTQEQRWCEHLAEALIFLHRPEVTSGIGVAPVRQMTAWFEQWLNGLVYELFFRGELHAHHLRLFEETAKLKPPKLPPTNDAENLGRLFELYAEATKEGSTLAAMLFSLRSLEPVRIIEGEA